MLNAWIVAKRELTAIFSQPIAYIVIMVLTFLTGIVFSGQIAAHLMVQFGQQSPPLTLGDVMGFFQFISLFVAPAITMRLLSDEHRTGTMELLMTLPIRDGEIILGKYLAAMLFYLIALLFTLTYPITLLYFGNPDIGLLLTTYLGSILALSAIVSLGILASTLTENQIVAYMMAFGFLLTLYFTGYISESLLSSYETISAIVREFSFPEHQYRFPQGIIEAKDIFYFVAVTAVALFASTRALESYRWR